MEKYRVKYVFVPINITTFRFNPSKIFFQLLVPTKISSLFFVPIFKLIFVFFLMKCVEYCKKIPKKKLEFFNKT